MLTTIIGIYLILGLPAALVIWMVLIASNGRKDNLQDLKYDRSKYKRFHERKTEPDSVRS
jgi:hypothetical protein